MLQTSLPPHVRTRLIVIAISVFITLLAMAFDAAAAAPGPDTAIESHKYADGVLLPRLTAAINDWHYQHPRDPENKPYQHAHTTSAGDVQRYREVREAFQKWDEAMRRAGY